MSILMVLWTILKVILIILAVLILLILLLTGIVLLSELSYGCKVRYSKRVDSVCRLKWLFGSVQLGMSFKNGDFSFNSKLPFGLERLFAKDKEKKKRKKGDNSAEEKSEDVQTAEKSNKADEEIKKNEDFKEETAEKSKKPENNLKKEKKKKEPNILVSLWKKYKEASEKYDLPEVFKLTIQFSGEFCKALGMKKCNVNGVIGFSDPSHTGLALGGIGMASAVLPADIYFEGDFEKESFKCNGVIEGRTNALKLLLPVLKYILKKPIWEIIKEFMRKED